MQHQRIKGATIDVKNLQYYLDLIAKQLSGNATAKEQADLSAWRNSTTENEQLFQDNQELWELSNSYQDSPLDLNLQQAWQNIAGQINPSISNPSPKKAVFSTKIWVLLIVVLATLGSLFWAWNYFQAPVEIVPTRPLAYQTQADEQQEITLPDGSKVWLNANSSLSYFPDFAERKVDLEGEAFFDIKRDEQRPFEIFTAGAKTRVLGTSFNVRAYPNEEKVEVTVTTGKVALIPLEKEKKDNQLLLTPGLSGTYTKKTASLEQQKSAIGNALAWHNKTLEFDHTLLPEVEKTLERYFNVDIELSNTLLNCDFKGTFENPNLEDVLSILEGSLDIQIEQSNNAYRLHGEGC